MIVLYLEEIDDAFGLFQPILDLMDEKGEPDHNGDVIEASIFITNTIKLTLGININELNNYLNENMEWIDYEEINGYDYPICKTVNDYVHCKRSIYDSFKWLSGGKLEDGWKRAKLIFPFLSKLFVKYMLCFMLI